MSRMKWTIVTDKAVPGVEKNRYIVSQTGEVWDMKLQRFLSKEITRGGYYRVNLHLEDGGMTRISLHRLVKIQHEGYDPDPEKNTIDHLNTDKHDNYLTNLDWVTGSENTLRAIRNGQYDQFELILEEADVHTICQMLKQGMNYMDISKHFEAKYGRPINTLVARIYRQEAWRHISKDYLPFPELTPSYFKVNDEIAHRICQLIQDGYRNRDIRNIIYEEYPHLIEAFATSKYDGLDSIVSDIRNKRRWTHISKYYNF